VTSSGVVTVVERSGDLGRSARKGESDISGRGRKNREVWGCSWCGYPLVG